MRNHLLILIVALCGCAHVQATAFNAGLSTVAGVDGVIPINDMTELSSASDTQYFEDGLHLAARGYTAVINRLTRDLFN